MEGVLLEMVLEGVVDEGGVLDTLRGLCRLRLVSRAWRDAANEVIRRRGRGARQDPQFRRELLNQVFWFKGGLPNFIESAGIGQLFTPQDLWNYRTYSHWPGSTTSMAEMGASLRTAFDMDAFRTFIQPFDRGLLMTNMVFVHQAIIVVLRPDLADTMLQWRTRVRGMNQGEIRHFIHIYLTGIIAGVYLALQSVAATSG